MHANTYILPEPPQDLLDQCTLVKFYDTTTPPWRMKKWCRENELSLMWFEFLDMSDLDSSLYDVVYKFYFIDAEDATIFRLKFE
jgi:hypothetical protein